MKLFNDMRRYKVTTITSLITLAFGVLLFNLIPTEHEVKIYYNLDYDQIHKHEILDGEIIASNGVVSINTGKFTGRSPKDKYIVKQPPSENDIWWGPVNKPMDPLVYHKLYDMVLNKGLTPLHI